MRAKLRDTEIYFDIDGAGLVVEDGCAKERRTAFLIHGGPGADHTTWKVRYHSLKERMQVVYFDHRGNGRSARGDPRTYNLDENVEDMEALRRHLGLGPIVSLGGSYGGMVAMAHAARYPDAVSHLVLACTAAHGGYITQAADTLKERGTPQQIAMFDRLCGGHIRDEAELRSYFEVMGPLYSRKYSLATATGLGPTLLETEPLYQAMKPDGFLRHFDLRPELSQITAPTLIIAGRHDWICPPSFSEEIHELIPGSDLRIFEQSSHTFGTDEPDCFIDVVAGFLVYNSNNRAVS